MTPLLIVEDEEIVAATMSRWLGGLGYTVTCTTTAESALAAMRETQPWVAVCDVGLPGHDGLWLADRVRRDYPETAVVLATGRNFLPPSATLRTGVISYLTKPFGREQLRTAVSAAVRWHQDVAADEGARTRLESAATERSIALTGRLRALHVEIDGDKALNALFPDRDERALIERVAEMALALAAPFKLPDADRDALRWAARLHRLYRLEIPDSILQSAEILSHAETDIVRRAPLELSKALAEYPSLASAAQLLHSLRERYDGLGVPDGLVGDHVPLGSRIIAVAEAIEAMAHARAHRPALTPAEVPMELQRCSGTRYDPDVVKAAIKLLAARSVN
jgi:putative two-component system response regulator